MSQLSATIGLRSTPTPASISTSTTSPGLIHKGGLRAKPTPWATSSATPASTTDIQFKHSIAAGKNFHATGGFGPWIVTADEIPDPTRLHLMTRLNGREVQHTGIDDLIFDIPTLISYCSDWTPLVAGDVISTGTPEGVGFARKPPLWMKPGDVVEVEIDGGVGVLRNPIIAEA